MTETVKVKGESMDNGERWIIEKKMLAPHIVTDV